jgi:hypothetical protein
MVNAAGPKSEARNPKQTETLKSEIQNEFGILCFLIIWICFEFRISSFLFLGAFAGSSRLGYGLHRARSREMTAEYLPLELRSTLTAALGTLRSRPDV